MWNNIKKSLIGNGADISTLSPSLVKNNETLLPHLFEQLDELTVEGCSKRQWNLASF